MEPFVALLLAKVNRGKTFLLLVILVLRRTTNYISIQTTSVILLELLGLCYKADVEQHQLSAEWRALVARLHNVLFVPVTKHWRNSHNSSIYANSTSLV